MVTRGAGLEVWVTTLLCAPLYLGGLAPPPPSSLPQFPPLQSGVHSRPSCSVSERGSRRQSAPGGRPQQAPPICHCYLHSFSLAERDMGERGLGDGWDLAGAGQGQHHLGLELEASGSLTPGAWFLLPLGPPLEGPVSARSGQAFTRMCRVTIHSQTCTRGSSCWDSGFPERLFCLRPSPA